MGQLLFRSQKLSDKEKLEKFQSMLPNLPPLANWTDFRWQKNNTQDQEETITIKSCSKRPKLIDIKERFIFHTNINSLE